jgi:hypothetical protein
MTAPPTYERSHSPWASGIALFAGLMLMMLGVMQFFQGLAAVNGGNIFVLTRDYAFKLDLTAWGWIFIVLGVVGALVGLGIILEMTLAYVLGMIVAVISILASFLFLPYYPVASMLLIAFDIAVIWALVAMIPRRV